MHLTDVEQRVLGVLMEKALTQPGSYPLTINAILLGANQKQNREPVVDYSEAEISRAVHALQVKGLVKQAPPSAGARANRFLHHAVETFHWDRREQAVMAELLLRGRQTAGELRNRAERMTPLPDLEAVNHVLRSLAGAATPFVEELAREPGRSANRWRHLLGGKEQPATTGVSIPPPTVDRVSLVGPAIEPGRTSSPPESDHDQRIRALEDRLTRVEAQLAEMAARSSTSG